jgi:chromosome partitioning protein
MARIVSVINLKGDIVKTTTTVSLAETLTARFKKKIFVIDLDPRTNATTLLIREEQW